MGDRKAAELGGVVGASAARAARRRWLAMPFIALGVAMIIVDATIVNVALPTIIRQLHIDAVTAEWVNSMYSLVFAALLISAGRLGDALGRRQLFVIGTVVFVAASLVSATAGSGAVLLFGRFLQGVGGAMVLPSTLSSVNAIFTGRERAAAFAIWGSTIGGVAALGPLLGGYLTTDFSWRWAFLINVPIGVAVVAGAWLLVPESRDPGSTGPTDLLGNILSALGLGGLVFGLIEAQSYGWWRAIVAVRLGPLSFARGGLSPVPFALALFVVAGLAFVVQERRRARIGRPGLVDPSLFRIRSFALGNVAALIVSLGEFGILFALPLFLQGVHDYSAFATGVLLLALAAGSLAAGGATPVLARRIGARGVARLGMTLEVLGIAGLGLSLSASGSGWRLVPTLVIYGLGVGMATAQLTGVILEEVPVEASGQGSGIQSTFRQVGSALGIAVLGTVLFTSLGREVSNRLATLGVGAGQRAALAAAVRNSGGAAIPALGHLPGGAALVHAAGLAMTAAARDAAWFAASFVAVGLLATFALPRAQGTATLEERGAAGRPAVRAPEQEPTSESEPERDPALEPDVVGGSLSV